MSGAGPEVLFGLNQGPKSFPDPFSSSPLKKDMPQISDLLLSLPG